MQAIESPDPVVLLIDEIDKAEPEFEAFLLEVLSDFQVSVPELGTIKAKHIPLVVLTSNNARELSDGLKRRCLHLFIDFPPPDEELAIIRLKVPEVSERLAQTVVTAVQRIRGLELRKAPSVSESLDWARSLVILNAEALDRELVESTLTMLVKHEKDLERVKGALDKVLADLAPSAERWTSASSSSSATSGAPSCASRPARRSTRWPPRRRSGSRAARRSRPRSPPRWSRSRATTRPSTGSSTCTSSTSRPSASGLKKALGPEDPRIQEMLDRLASEEGLELDELTELMLRGEGSDMEMAIREGGQTAGLERLMYFLQIGYFSRRIYDKFDWEAIERDLSQIMQMLEAKGHRPRAARAHPQLPRPAPRGLPQA